MKTIAKQNELVLYTFLNENQLSYVIHTHIPIHTVAEGKVVSQNIPGAHNKNLFLKDKKGHFFLVSVLEDKRVNLKQLSKDVGKGGLSFGSVVELQERLQLLPGSVTPFGLLSKQGKNVHYILDEDFLQYEHVSFHPLRNDKTVQMPTNDFLRFLELISHVPTIRPIPELMGHPN